MTTAFTQILRSLLRLVVSIMMDINEEWITGRKYMNMEID